MICPKIPTTEQRRRHRAQPNRATVSVNFYRYEDLHLNGRTLIQAWFLRAWEERIDIKWVQKQKNVFERWGTDEFTELVHLEQHNFFEAFSYLWYAFNGWASCVTDADTDKGYINALAADDIIQRDFLHFMHMTGSPLTFYAGLFAKLWPIFEDRSLQRLGIFAPPTTIRQETVRYYLEHGAFNFQPECWKKHQDADEPAPTNWFHTLHALYKVRCNLFHGGKTPDSEIDQQIIFSAFHTLLYFLRFVNYFQLDNYPDEYMSE